MTPKMVYLATVGLATLQTTQAFLIPSSFTFPEFGKDGKVGKAASHDEVNALPIAKEDMREKLKNLQLGVSKPFPFPIHSGDAQEASEKAKHYFRKACKKFKGHMHELENDAQDFGHKFKHYVQDVQDDVPNFAEKINQHTHKLQGEVPEFAHKAEKELEELDRKLLEWWKDHVPSMTEVQDDVEGLGSEIEAEIEDIDWSKFFPTSIKGDAVEDTDDVPNEESTSTPEGVQAFSVSFSYPDDAGNDDNSIYVELVNMETGEITRERFDLSGLDMDFDDSERLAEPFYTPGNPINTDTVISPEWQDKMRLSPHTRGRMRCMASRFRRVMRSVASGLRAFITGFLIPVLIGVAAGMAASLFGMLVGTLCGWLWVKLFRGGRRTDNEAEFVEYRPAGDGLGEKDTLLVIESVDSDEDAPPVYVEKE